MMKQTPCIIALWLTSILVARAGDLDPITFPALSDPDRHGQVLFSMPSGNIDCVFTPAYFNGVANYDGDDAGLATLECQRHEPTHIDIFIGEKTNPHIEKADYDGDASAANAPSFPYGHSWRGGPFECDSRADGLYCSRIDGHGFRVSRSKAEVF